MKLKIHMAKDFVIYCNTKGDESFDEWYKRSIDGGQWIHWPQDDCRLVQICNILTISVVKE